VTAETVKVVEITAAVGGRLDSIMAESEFSRSRAQKLIRGGRVEVNGNTVTKPSERVEPGDVLRVRVPEPEPLSAHPEAIPINVIYQDDSVLVVDKPRGMVVHPAPGNQSGTLVNALLAHCGGNLSDANGIFRPGIVHRIDKDTTGLLLIVKTNEAHLAIAEQIKAHSLTRAYLALVHGNVKEEGVVETLIGRNPRDRKKMAVISGASGSSRNAVTRYKPLEWFGRYTLVECRLQTGRTHQIRVHMRHLGHPIVGDKTYGVAREAGAGRKLAGQLLHAHILGFVHPKTGEYMEFTASIPADFQEIMDKLRQT
jgi:23S rRNA pseudouridine1911/1915/1917 synthase